MKPYIELLKIRLVSLTILSALVGYYMAANESILEMRFLFMILGLTLSACGSMALNQWLEQKEDALMHRTMKRPLPAGDLSPKQALVTGISLSLIGLLTLVLGVNFECFLVTAAIVISYLFIYTPLKKKTSWNTVVGAVPGALPPVAGWAAVRGDFSFESWILFSIIFLWQLPHFLAISWAYREDYARAGFKMLTTESADPFKVNQVMIVYTFALIPVSLLPTFFGMTGAIYFFGTLVTGVIFAVKSLQNLKDLNKTAKPFFFLSLIYLTVVLLLMVLDKQ